MDSFNDTVGIFPGDVIIKSAIELFIDDIRKNPWIIEDIFKAFIENPILKQKYGLKEVSRAKEFILNNNIPIYMAHRVDKQEFPCITISIGSSYEDKDLATLADLSVETQEYSPSDIGQTINFIIPPFNPTSYDSATGIVEVPETIEDYKYISAGMVAIDPKTGFGYIVEGKAGINGFKIEIGANLPNQIAIIPRYQLFRARRERAISQETYNIGCHAHGDPSTLLFLYGIVKYGLYRYREGLLEYNNFQLSKLSVTDMIKNDSFSMENVYSRWITLSGQVEESWIKTPFRLIEGIDLIEEISTGEEGETSAGGEEEEEASSSIPGIQILSSEAPEELKNENGLWTTIDDNDD